VPFNDVSVRSAAQRYLKLARHYKSSGLESTNFRVYQGRAIYPRQAGRCKLSDAIILTGEWFVIANRHVLSDGFVQTPMPPISAYLVQFRAPANIDLLFEEPEELPVGLAFLLGGCANYTHWILDFLPRLKFAPNGEVPLLVNGPLMPFQRESLFHLRIDPARLIELGYPKAYKTKSLIVPYTGSSIVTPPLQFEPGIVKWVRQVFCPLCSSRKPDRLIFISRAGHAAKRSRRLLNHEEIAEMAAHHGFEIVRCEELPLAEQVRLFSEAQVIAGPHGSGFTNMVFAPPNTRIIEMIGPRYDRDKTGGSLPYVKLAYLLEQRHTRIVGHSDTGSVEMDYLPNETYTITPNQFVEALRN
jgi:hypothetical protein